MMFKIYYLSSNWILRNPKLVTLSSIQRFGVSKNKRKKKKKTFIHQECIKLITTNSKDFYISIYRVGE